VESVSDPVVWASVTICSLQLRRCVVQPA